MKSLETGTDILHVYGNVYDSCTSTFRIDIDLTNIKLYFLCWFMSINETCGTKMGIYRKHSSKNFAIVVVKSCKLAKSFVTDSKRTEKYI